MRISKNPSDDQIREIIRSSQHKAARLIIDEDTGNSYVWPAEDGTHRQGADQVGIAYNIPPGMGTILTD